MTEGRFTSEHESIREVQSALGAAGLESAFDRAGAQAPRCRFGSQGVCCRLCSHGPCRVTNRSPRGVCGAAADTIVARNLLHLTAMGASAYAHHAEEAAHTLAAAAEGRGPWKIRDEAGLRRLAAGLGLDGEAPVAELAREVAAVVLDDLRRGSDRPQALLQAVAPPDRREVWGRLGITPGGLHSEVRDALTRGMSNVNTDPADLLLACLRLGVGTGFAGLAATVLLQDILLGTPRPTESAADLGILDPGTVNIVAHGHLPFVGTAVLAAARDPELLRRAGDAGAEGIKVYGSMCTGQELLQRKEASAQGFAGQLGNWLAQEFMVATGLCDLVMMDLNCSIPGMRPIAERTGTRLVSVNRLLRMDGVDEAVDYDPARADEQARDLVLMAIEAYGRRRGGVHAPRHRAPVLAGFSAEAIVEALGGSLEPLIDTLRGGGIRGIAAVVGCTNTENGHDSTAVAVCRELIRRDVLVINAGCVSSAAQIAGLQRPEAADLAGDRLAATCGRLGIPPCLNFGSCLDIGRIVLTVGALAEAVGVDPAQLPVAVSAPEYMEQKAVADGMFAVALGLFTHLAPVPPVTGGGLVTRMLTEDVGGLTGGRVLVELDPERAAVAITEHIDRRREDLGLQSTGPV